MDDVAHSDRNRAEGWEKSYQEVLSADKHQDQKLSQTLVALAFLSAAGATLFRDLDRGMQFGQAGPNPTEFFFVLFLVTVGVSLVTALVAIGPNSPLTFLRAGRPPASLLYYTVINEDAKWREKLDLDGPTLWRTLAENFHGEAKSLAGRVDYKIARARESAAFVQLAVVCLVRMGVFGSKQLGPNARWWIAAALLMILLLLPFWDRLQMHRFKFPEPGSRPAYVVLSVAVACAVVLLATARHGHREWMAMYLALADLLAIRLSVVSRTLAVVLVPLAALASFVVLIVSI